MEKGTVIPLGCCILMVKNMAFVLNQKIVMPRGHGKALDKALNKSLNDVYTSIIYYLDRLRELENKGVKED